MITGRFSTVLLATTILLGGGTIAVRMPAMSALPSVPHTNDAASISEARSIAQNVGDTLWAGWSTTPFVIDLLTPQYEHLLNASSIPKGFARLPSGEAYRKRTFPSNLEATFPAFDATPIIVIGEQPLTAARTPTRWVVTLLHEHFHQWQDSWKPYQTDVRALGLTHGDRTGMWMLDYPFPYGSAAVDARFEDLASHLAAAVQSARTARFDSALRAYLQTRAAWKASQRRDDYKYFAFQCWQEGVARYTEYRVAELASRSHDANATFLTASQAQLLERDARATYAGIVRQLTAASLAARRRTAFYAVGAGEALLLDQAVPRWRERYLNAHMDLGIFLPSVPRRNAQRPVVPSRERSASSRTISQRSRVIS